MWQGKVLEVLIESRLGLGLGLILFLPQMWQTTHRKDAAELKHVIAYNWINLVALTSPATRTRKETLGVAWRLRHKPF
jgi:hypothetical protein